MGTLKNGCFHSVNRKEVGFGKFSSHCLIGKDGSRSVLLEPLTMTKIHRYVTGDITVLAMK